MKKLTLLLSTLFAILLVSSCISFGSLFPNVQSPDRGETSLLILGAGTVGGGGALQLQC